MMLDWGGILALTCSDARCLYPWLISYQTQLHGLKDVYNNSNNVEAHTTLGLETLVARIREGYFNLAVVV